jgi:hypothetical protein
MIYTHLLVLCVLLTKICKELYKAAWDPIYANIYVFFLDQFFYNECPDDSLLLGRNM